MAVQPNELRVVQASTQLGGVKTTTVATGTDQLFDLFTGTESAAGIVDYACAYIENTSAQTAFGVSFYVNVEDAFEAVNLQVASGLAAIDATEAAVPDINTPPAVTFTEAGTAGAAISIGDLPAGSSKSIWFRLDIPAGTSATNFNYGLRVSAETEA